MANRCVQQNFPLDFRSVRIKRAKSFLLLVQQTLKQIQISCHLKNMHNFVLLFHNILKTSASPSCVKFLPVTESTPCFPVLVRNNSATLLSRSMNIQTHPAPLLSHIHVQCRSTNGSTVLFFGLTPKTRLAVWWCSSSAPPLLHRHLNWDLPGHPCSGAPVSLGAWRRDPLWLTVNDKAKVSAFLRSQLDSKRISTAAQNGAPGRMIESALKGKGLLWIVSFWSLMWFFRSVCENRSLFVFTYWEDESIMIGDWMLHNISSEIVTTHI